MTANPDGVRLLALAESIVDTCRECRLGKTQASLDYNFDNSRAQCIKFVLDVLCAALVPQCDGEPVAWRVSAGNNIERHLFENKRDAQLMRDELEENGWLDVELIELYAAPARCDAPRTPLDLSTDELDGLAREAFGNAAAAAQRFDAGSVEASEPYVFTYKNHRGETDARIVTPIGIRFGSTEWHKTPQWLMRAFDHEKRAEREFAMFDMSPALPAGEEVRRAHEAFDRMLRNNVIEECAKVAHDRRRIHNNDINRANRRVDPLIARESEAAIIEQLIRALSPSSNGKPATENEG